MVKRVLGWGFPAVTGLVVVAVSYALNLRSSVSNGIAFGITVAVVQAYVSIASLKWAWNRQSFWWVWGGGVLFRIVVFAVVAFFVYRFTSLSLVATMATMVVSTTVFLVVESVTCLKG